MPRIVFPATATHADMLAWCRQRLAEPLRIPEPLPTVRRHRPEPDDPLPEMFDRLPVQRKGELARPAGTPLYKVVGEIFEGVIRPPSPLAEKRRARRAEREAAAKAAAREAKAARKQKVKAAPAEPALALTMDMDRWMKAHGKDKIDFEPRIGHPHRVSCPPFHLHDEAQTDPVDEFLGQVVGIEPARALLFRRRDPDVMDGCEVGQRYVLLRFWDDEDGQVWSMPVDGDDDAAVRTAIRTTISLHGRSWRETG